MPLKQCKCGRAVPKLPCDECKRKKQRLSDDKNKGNARGFHQSHAWTVLSREKRSRDPLCERCKWKGRVEAATEVHHIRPVRTHPQLAMNPNNLMSLCDRCHRAVERGCDLWPKR